MIPITARSGTPQRGFAGDPDALRRLEAAFEKEPSSLKPVDLRGAVGAVVNFTGRRSANPFPAAPPFLSHHLDDHVGPAGHAQGWLR
jgi:hypothetical protein